MGLFSRCRKEYENRDEAAKGDEAVQKRFHAFVLFLAELYLNLEVKEVVPHIIPNMVLVE